MEKDCKERKRDQKSGRDRTRKTVGIGYSVRFGLKLIFNQLKSIIYTPPPPYKNNIWAVITQENAAESCHEKYTRI